MKKILYAILLMSFFLGACYKDKGNYDYDPIPKINIEGLEKEYIVLGKTYLKIDPQFSHKEDYRFVWTIFSNSKSMDMVDTISQEPELNYLVTKDVDSYTLALSVENIKSQDKQFFKSKVTVRTRYTTGWYVLKSIQGQTDFDHYDDAWGQEANVLFKNQGHHLAGNPVALAYSTEISYIDSEGGKKDRVRTLWAVSDRDGQMLRIDNMELAYNLDKAFFTWIPNQQIRGIQQQGAELNFYSDRGLYGMALNIGSAMPRFADPMKITNLSPGLPDSYLLSKKSYMSSSFNMYYDEQNTRFLLMKASSNSLFSFTDTDVFGRPVTNKPNRMNADLLHMGRNTNHGYAVMKDRTSTDRFIYKLEIKAYDEKSNFFSPIIDKLLIPVSSKLYQAQVYANNAELPYLFYSTGSDLHMYDYDAKKETQNIVPNYDGKVTYIRHLYWRWSDEPRFDYFIVATEKGGRYKIYFYQILAGKPDLTKEVKVIEGEGAVQALQYVHSSMPPDGFAVYPK